jgi:hypothetical protein
MRIENIYEKNEIVKLNSLLRIAEEELLILKKNSESFEVKRLQFKTEDKKQQIDVSKKCLAKETFQCPLDCNDMQLEYSRYSIGLKSVSQECKDISADIASLFACTAQLQEERSNALSENARLREANARCREEIARLHEEAARAALDIRRTSDCLVTMIDACCAAQRDAELAVDDYGRCALDLRAVTGELIRYRAGMSLILKESAAGRQIMQELCTENSGRFSLAGPSTIAESLRQTLGWIIKECSACNEITVECMSRKFINQSDTIQSNDNTSENCTMITSCVGFEPEKIEIFKKAKNIHYEDLFWKISAGTEFLDNTIHHLYELLPLANDLSTPSPEMIHSFHSSFSNLFGGLKQRRSNCCFAQVDHILFLAGGTDGHLLVHDIEFFDLEMNRWGKTASLPSQRVSFQLVSGRGKLLVIGGEDAYGNVLSSCLEYNPVTDMWLDIEPLSQARTRFAATYIQKQGVIIVAGGISDILN